MWKNWNPVLNKFVEIKNEFISHFGEEALWNYNSAEETCLEYWVRLLGKEDYKKLRTALWDGAKVQLDNFIKEKIAQKNRDVECYAMMINVIKSRQKELEQNKRMLAKKKAQAQSSIVVLEGVKDEQLNLDVDPSLRLVKKQK